MGGAFLGFDDFEGREVLAGFGAFTVLVDLEDLELPRLLFPDESVASATALEPLGAALCTKVSEPLGAAL